MKDLNQQRISFLESELTELRYQISDTQEWGFDQIEFTMGIGAPFKIYLGLIIVMFLLLGFYEELTVKNTALNKWVKQKLGHNDLHEFLARESRSQNMPYDDEVPICDYKTMTPKRFFNDYVKQNRPCLFPEYGKLQKAYHLWQNETYLLE